MHNASDLPEQADFLDFTDGAFENTQGKYLLSGEAFNFSEDKYVPFTVGFTDAEVRVDIFRADEHDFTGTPWDYLQSTAYGIISKNELSGEYLNEREKELLPLLYDISSLFFPINIPQEFADGLSCIKEYISKYGYSKPLKLVELFEKQQPDSKKRDSISKKTA